MSKLLSIFTDNQSFWICWIFIAKAFTFGLTIPDTILVMVLLTALHAVRAVDYLFPRVDVRKEIAQLMIEVAELKELTRDQTMDLNQIKLRAR